MKQPVIDTYTDPVLGLIKVIAPKNTKRHTSMKNDTFYGAKMRIDDDSCFVRFSRKAGRA